MTALQNLKIDLQELKPDELNLNIPNTVRKGATSTENLQILHDYLDRLTESLASRLLLTESLCDVLDDWAEVANGSIIAEEAASFYHKLLDLDTLTNDYQEIVTDVWMTRRLPIGSIAGEAFYLPVKQKWYAAGAGYWCDFEIAGILFEHDTTDEEVWYVWTKNYNPICHGARGHYATIDAVQGALSDSMSGDDMIATLADAFIGNPTIDAATLMATISGFSASNSTYVTQLRTYFTSGVRSLSRVGFMSMVSKILEDNSSCSTDETGFNPIETYAVATSALNVIWDITKSIFQIMLPTVLQCFGIMGQAILLTLSAAFSLVTGLTEVKNEEVLLDLDPEDVFSPLLIGAPLYTSSTFQSNNQMLREAVDRYGMVEFILGNIAMFVWKQTPSDLVYTCQIIPTAGQPVDPSAADANRITADLITYTDNSQLVRVNSATFSTPNNGSFKEAIVEWMMEHRGDNLVFDPSTYGQSVTSWTVASVCAASALIWMLTTSEIAASSTDVTFNGVSGISLVDFWDVQKAWVSPTATQAEALRFMYVISLMGGNISWNRLGLNGEVIPAATALWGDERYNLHTGYNSAMNLHQAFVAKQYTDGLTAQVAANATSVINSPAPLITDYPGVCIPMAGASDFKVSLRLPLVSRADMRRTMIVTAAMAAAAAAVAVTLKRTRISRCIKRQEKANAKLAQVTSDREKGEASAIALYRAKKKMARANKLATSAGIPTLTPGTVVAGTSTTNAINAAESIGATALSLGVSNGVFDADTCEFLEASGLVQTPGREADQYEVSTLTDLYQLIYKLIVGKQLDD